MNEDEEKRLLESYRQLSPRNQHIALAQILAGAEMEKNARRMIRNAIGQSNGLAELDASLFNGVAGGSGAAIAV